MKNKLGTILQMKKEQGLRLNKQFALPLPRIEEIIEGSEPKVNELDSLASILDVDTSTVISLYNDDYLERHVALRESYIQSMIDNNDISNILLLINRNKLFIKEDSLWFKTVHKEHKVDNENLLQDLYRLLLANGYVYYVNHTLGTTYGYKINSLSDLDQFGKEVKKYYLYGIIDHQTSTNCVQSFVKTKHFEHTFNSLPYDDQQSLLNGLLELTRNELRSINLIANADTEVIEVNGDLFMNLSSPIDDGNVYYHYDSYDLHFACINDVFKDIVNEIIAIASQINELLKSLYIER